MVTRNDVRIPAVARELFRIEYEQNRGVALGNSLGDEFQHYISRGRNHDRLILNSMLVLRAIDEVGQVKAAEPQPKRQLTPDELWDTIVKVSKP